MIRNLQLHHFFKQLKGLDFFGFELEELSDEYKDNDFSPVKDEDRLLEESAYSNGAVEQNIVSGDPDIMIDCVPENGGIHISMDAGVGFIGLDDVNADPMSEPMAEAEYERYLKADIANVFDEVSDLERAIKGRARQIADAANLRLSGVKATWDYDDYNVWFAIDIELTNLD